MTRKALTAEAVTALIFDPIPQAAPRRSVMSMLCGMPETVVNETPRYRSLDEAMQELCNLGMHPTSVKFLRTGVECLAFKLVEGEEKASNGTFNRRKNVKWDDGSAYLGIRFINPDIDLTVERAHQVAAIRKMYLTDAHEYLSGIAETSVPRSERGVMQPAMA